MDKDMALTILEKEVNCKVNCKAGKCPGRTCKNCAFYNESYKVTEALQEAVKLLKCQTVTMTNVRIQEKELYQEIELYDGDTKIGEAEVEIKGKMLAWLNIGETYRGQGYGHEAVKMLTEKYGLNVLWVNADNARAIHVYEDCGYKKGRPTMYEMNLNESKSE